MEKDKHIYTPLSNSIIENIKADLSELDRIEVDVEGRQLKPSQCYRFGLNPVHVLFNTNCPDDLKEKVRAILSKYIPDHENHSPQ
jgi:hypothetical protein